MKAIEPNNEDDQIKRKTLPSLVNLKNHKPKHITVLPISLTMK